MGGVYLLHFTPPYRHAKHYIGYSDNIPARIERHKNGNGNPLVRAAIDAGCNVVLARVWEGEGRTFERHLKNAHNASRFCPICKGEISFDDAQKEEAALLARRRPKKGG